MQVVVQRVAAWSVRRDGGAIETPAAWSEWAAAPAPEPLGSEGQPEVKFLPAGVRRRATRLTRMMLQVAFDATEGIDRGTARTVFASRHGAIHVAVRILASIAKEELVSPLQFSHSVHNAQAGLFSIAAGNREASSSIAAESDTFGHGFLEALLHLERSPAPVLFVMADEPLPANLAHLVEEPEGAYAVALLLSREGEGPRLEFSLAATKESPSPRAWPDAIEFVRFLCNGETELTLGHGRRRWSWKRNA